MKGKKLRKKQKEVSLEAKVINNLHKSLEQKKVETASVIGKHLIDQKEKVGHCNWQNWIRINLVFSASKARRYMAIYRHQEFMPEDEKADYYELTLEKAFNETGGKVSKFPNSYHRNNDKARAVIRELFADKEHSYQNPPEDKVLNQIINADTIKAMKKMKPNSVHLICTSIPYNVGLFYGKDIDDSRPYHKYLDWLGEFIEQCYRVLVKGGRLVINCDNTANKDKANEGEMSYKHLVNHDLRDVVRSSKLNFKEYEEDIIWYKKNKGNVKIMNWGSYKSASNPHFRNCKEYIMIWSKDVYELSTPEGVESDLTDDEFKDWTHNIWELNPNTRKNCPHPCTWTEKLTERLVKLFSFPTQTVLDPFCGSGTTCLTANKLNRNFIGIDLNPNYCQWSRDRVDGKDMDLILAKFLYSVKPQLEESLGKDLVDEKYSRYFAMAQKTAIQSISKKRNVQIAKVNENISFERKSA